MLHDIEPHKFSNEWKEKSITDKDILLNFCNGEVLLIKRQGELHLPLVREIGVLCEIRPGNVTWLFSIDDQSVFLHNGPRIHENESLAYYKISVFRQFPTMHGAFVGATAAQLYRFYQDNLYCGHCQTKMEQSKMERALCCPECGHIVYPKISPAIIVAITDGKRLLMTKYAHSDYKRYALVAGFTEIGESLEQTVHREVMEEVGLKVKNVTYYKSSPWGFTDTLMVGFFAELDGSDKITLQESELCEAVWMKPSEIPVYDSKISISQELIQICRKRLENIDEI